VVTKIDGLASKFTVSFPPMIPATLTCTALTPSLERKSGSISTTPIHNSIPCWSC